MPKLASAVYGNSCKDCDSIYFGQTGRSTLIGTEGTY